MDIILQNYPEMCSSSDSDLATLGPRGFLALGGAEGAKKWWGISCLRYLQELKKHLGLREIQWPVIAACESEFMIFLVQVWMYNAWQKQLSIYTAAW